jgi:hypothetical protein
MEASPSSSSVAAADDDDGPEPVTVLTDVLLSLLAQPSQLLRAVALASFEALTPRMTAAALDTILAVLRTTGDSDGAEEKEEDSEEEGDNEQDDGADKGKRPRPSGASAADAADALAAQMVRAALRGRFCA